MSVTGVRLTVSDWPADTSRPVPELTVGELLRQAAAEVPDRVVLAEATPAGAPSLTGAGATDRTWTYAGLLDDAERAAAWLLERFAPGERVTVWAPNVPEWVVLQYGAALAGLVLVTANPALRPQELAYVLGQSRSAGVVHTAGFRDTDMAGAVAGLRPGLPELREAVELTGWLEEVRASPPRAQLPAVVPGDPCQIQYTSGTTGFPKGALLHHRGLVANAGFFAQRWGGGAGSRWVTAMPLFHTGGCAMGVLGAASTRSTLVLCQYFDPVLLMEAVQHWQADALSGVPTMLIALMEHPRRGEFDLTSLRRVLSGGASVPAELVRRVERSLGVTFGTVYGQTELSPVVTQTAPEDSVEDKAETVGRPLPQVEVRVVDPLTGAVLPCGDQGEIVARGYQTMLGYFELPEETAQTVDTDGWLHTGDLGTMDERGYLRITGRLKDMVIRGGENIYPREVEEVLFTHPGVADVAVVGVPDPTWGEQLVAVLRLAGPTTQPSALELRTFVRERLAPHKTPARWYRTEDFPLTGSGKVQKFRIRELIARGELAELS